MTTRLRVYSDSVPDTAVLATTDFDQIQSELGQRGVRIERWNTGVPVAPGDPPEAVLAAYREPIAQLMAAGKYQSVDVISLNADHPDKDTLRAKFLNEHTHAEDEVRFFVAGQGLFTLHIGSEVLEVLCCKNDLIAVPAGTPHWFDMGPQPSFVAIRIFTNPAGWVANFTGDTIAERFPRLDA